MIAHGNARTTKCPGSGALPGLKSRLFAHGVSRSLVIYIILPFVCPAAAGLRALRTLFAHRTRTKIAKQVLLRSFARGCSVLEMPVVSEQIIPAAEADLGAPRFTGLVPVHTTHAGGVVGVDFAGPDVVDVSPIHVLDRRLRCFDRGDALLGLRASAARAPAPHNGLCCGLDGAAAVTLPEPHGGASADLARRTDTGEPPVALAAEIDLWLISAASAARDGAVNDV